MEKLVCNGIDVTECTLKCGKDCALYYAQLNSDNKNLEFGYLCQDNPDCYYKQLARLNNQCEKILEQNRRFASGTCPV